MSKRMILSVFNVEHGACAMLSCQQDGELGQLAMIDVGDNATTGWNPGKFVREAMGRSCVDYLFVTNTDQDHLSGLAALRDGGVAIATLTTNRSMPPATLRAIKREGGGVTASMEQFLAMRETYVHPVSVPFDSGMNGITATTFWNVYPEFEDTNNLSLVVFIKFGTFKILFPGDVEKAGWLRLLENPAFVAELQGTTILVASHHGRENGFCADVFKHFTPQAVVISDKPIVHGTQEMVHDYRAVTQVQGVPVGAAGQRRHVLTTRRDGTITFVVEADGSFSILTEAGNDDAAKSA